MVVLIDIVVLMISIVLLWKGAEWIVDGAAQIGRSAGLSDLVIGLTVVAFGTSAPEFAVTISAAASGRGAIAVSNVIGSNVFNLGLILGGCALVRALLASRSASRRDGPVLIGVAFLVALFLFDARLDRFEGAILMSLLLIYLAVLFRSREPIDEELPAGKATWKSGIALVAGLAAVAGGGHLLVASASELAALAGVPEWLVGLTIVAAGTSASEMATSIVAVLRRRNEMLVGNLIGSDIFNMLGVLGLAAIIKPIHAEGADPIGLGGLVLTCVLVGLFLRTRGRISGLEGGILVALGLGRWAIAAI